MVVYVLGIQFPLVYYLGQLMRKNVVSALNGGALMAALILLSGVGSRGDERPVIPNSAAAKIIEEDSKEVQKVLTANKILARDRRRALVSTIVIAAAANENAKDPRMAAVRDQAIKVLDALAKDDSDTAKDAALELTKVNPADTGAARNLELQKYFRDGEDYDRDTLMQLFKSTRVGGLGIETMIQKYAKAAPPAKEMDNIMAALYRVLILTEVIDKVAPEGKAAKWGGYSKALKEALADATTKKKPDDVKTALNRIDGACAACHAEFKNRK